MRKHDGYFIKGKYQTVAWYSLRQLEEAKKECKHLNSYGGTSYTIENSYKEEVEQ